MSIDGIGRPPVPPAGAGPIGAGTPAGASETFQIQRGSEASATPSTSLLDRLERGELSVDEYLDARVDEAVAPFESRLPAEQVDFIKASLRSELQSDPVLVELVQRATGALPRDPSG